MLLLSEGLQEDIPRNNSVFSYTPSQKIFPNLLYHLFQNRIYIKLLMLLERLLEMLFGKSFLGRELFVACVK